MYVNSFNVQVKDNRKGGKKGDKKGDRKGDRKEDRISRIFYPKSSAFPARKKASLEINFQREEIKINL